MKLRKNCGPEINASYSQEFEILKIPKLKPILILALNPNPSSKAIPKA